ncbi:class I SAM-dependent methyltransferase [Amycolatopsis magusensis]|uniref:class I SAM-dependent methyltransferase n=1 Tax=Amycolatopsis magusensis TaxID=882444 RepID=UPI00378F1329
MTAPKIFSEFTEGLNEINATEGSRAFSDSRSVRMKDTTSSVYDMAAAGSAKGDIWNWGMYDPVVAKEIAELIPGFGEFDTDGISEQLYYTALKAVPIEFGDYAGRSVLEVGCGMGEGLNFLSRVAGGGEFTGLDLSPRAIERATATLSRGRTLRYVQGDAEELPFGDGEVDVVINIESSHTYPDLARFLGEVSRVLKPGGYFSHIDVFTAKRLEVLRSLKDELPGLDWVHEQDLSPQVKAGIRRRLAPGSHFHRKLAEKRVPALARPIVKHSSAVIFGGVFAGHQDTAYIKLLRKLGVLPSGRHLEVESYRHHVAVKRA